MSKNKKVRLIISAIMPLILLASCSPTEEDTPTPTPSPTVSSTPEEKPSVEPTAPAPTEEEDGYVTRTVGGVKFELPETWIEYDASELSDPSAFNGLPGKVYTPKELAEIPLPLGGGQEVLFVRESGFNEEVLALLEKASITPSQENLPAIFGFKSTEFSELEDGSTLSSTSFILGAAHGVRNNSGFGADFLLSYAESAFASDFKNSIEIVDHSYVNSDAIFEAQTEEDLSGWFSQFPEFPVRNINSSNVKPLEGVSSKHVELGENAGYVYLTPSENSQHMTLSDGNPLGGKSYRQLGKTLSSRPALLFNIFEVNAPYVYVNSTWEGWELVIVPIQDMPEITQNFEIAFSGTTLMRNDGSAKVVNFDGEGVREVWGYDSKGNEYTLVKSSEFFVIPEGIVFVGVQTESEVKTKLSTEELTHINHLNVNVLEPGVKYLVNSDTNRIPVLNPNGLDFTVITLEPVKNSPIQKSSERQVLTPHSTYLIYLN